MLATTTPTMKTILLVGFTLLASIALVIGAHIEAGRKSEPFHWVTGR